MNTKEKLFEITNGPSKDALFDMCKYAFAKNVKVTIEPRFAIGRTVPLGPGCGCAHRPIQVKGIVIVGIYHENGSGDCFNLYGNCQADLRVANSEKAVYENYKFTAYYDSRTRQGTITFE